MPTATVLDAWDVPAMPYIDFTASGLTIAQYAQSAGITGCALGFVVVKDGSTALTWGGFYDATTYKPEQVREFRSSGGIPVISFGGAANFLPETKISSVSSLYDSYHGIIDAYGVNHIDFNIEGQSKTSEVPERHVALVTKLVAAKPGLKISYTLQITIGAGTSGLDQWSVDLLKALAKAGITPSLVTPMTMYMWQPAVKQWPLAQQVVQGTQAQLRTVFGLAEQDAWRRTGCCPMYGDNGGHGNWTLEDQQSLCDFAKKHQMGCVSGWSTNIDAGFGFAYEKVRPQDIVGSRAEALTSPV
jgi:chitinase